MKYLIEYKKCLSNAKHFVKNNNGSTRYFKTISEARGYSMRLIDHDDAELCNILDEKLFTKLIVYVYHEGSGLIQYNPRTNKWNMIYRNGSVGKEIPRPRYVPY